MSESFVRVRNKRNETKRKLLWMQRGKENIIHRQFHTCSLFMYIILKSNEFHLAQGWGLLSAATVDLLRGNSFHIDYSTTHYMGILDSKHISS